MMTVVISILLVSLAVLGMAVGVLMGRKPIQGTCGGLNQLQGNSSCELCGGNPQRCETSRGR